MNFNQNGNFSLIPAVVILLFITSIGGYYLGTTKSKPAISPLKQALEQTPLPSPYSLMSTSCSKKECLFYNSREKAVHGYASLQGYYHQYPSDDFGVPRVCNSIIVTGGSENLISSFKQAIDEGNGLNKLNKDNNLMVNINLEDLSSDFQQKIKSSNLNNQIELGIIRVTPQVITTGSTCTSFLDVISTTKL